MPTRRRNEDNQGGGEKIVFVKGEGVVEVGVRLQAEHYPRVKFRIFPGSSGRGEITQKVQ